jgi:hypothetical protein
MSNSSNKFQTSSETSYSGAAELWAIENALSTYNQKIVSKISGFFTTSSRILEFGAGIGTLARIWGQQTNTKPECLEIDPNLQRIIRDRGLSCYGRLEDIGGLFDGIYTSNVLEHIEDDCFTLSQLYDKLKEGGIIAVYVPAFMALYSNMDLAVGHYRRYRMNELSQKLQNAGFRITYQSYSDSIGFFVWWCLKMRGSNGGDELSNHRALSIYDKYIYPLSSLFDSLGFKYFFGKNLLMVAKK